MTLDISQQAAVDQISKTKKRRRRQLEDITQKTVRELFSYRDGFLYRKKAAGRWGNIPAGQVAGGYSKRGYHEMRLNGETFVTHRIIWLYHYGYLPENDIDHINRNKMDNRIENLREVSHQCNIRNTYAPAHNTSGVKGVSYDSKRGKWKAYVKIGGKNIQLGRFYDFIEAIAHRFAVEQCLGWGRCDFISTSEHHIRQYIERYKR